MGSYVLCVLHPRSRPHSAKVRVFVEFVLDLGRSGAIEAAEPATEGNAG